MVNGFYRSGDGGFVCLILFDWMIWVMGFPPKVRVIELVGMIRSLRSYIGWRGERNISHGVGNLSVVYAF